MKSLGYGVVETVASPDGGVGRVDSCGLYFREDGWKCLNHETIRLDDLAILRSSSQSDDEGVHTTNIATKRSKERAATSGNERGGSVKGFERSFLRKNVALLATMEHKPSRRQILIVVCHLFWNPAYEYVKVRTDFFLTFRNQLWNY